MYQLVAKSGINKGITWQIDEEPLVIGRDSACHIRVADGMVSRRHCRVERNDDRLLLIDLGSRNCTLVNGRPANSCELKAGDVIAVGSERLLVTSREQYSEKSPLVFKPDSTISFGQPSSPVVQGESQTLSMEVDQTVHDLADIFALSREMWTVKSSEEVLDKLASWLAPRFSPRAAWISQVDNIVDSGRPVLIHGTASEADMDALLPFTAKATQSCLALWGSLDMESQPGAGFICAPMAIGPQITGILVVVAGNPTQTFDENEAQLLAAAAHIAAPSLMAMQRIEQLGVENEQLRRAQPDRPMLIGKSRAMNQLRASIRKAAPSDLNVLIEGETGSGKEVVARLVHDMSDRRDMPFVAVNCAAIPRDLLESELFGHEKGAFTGAVQSKPGLIDICEGGTLFLDEVGELAPENQARLLRVLETRRYRRLGGSAEIETNFRVVAATNKILAHEIRRGGFRQDLYYRLNTITLRTPALRERPSDIPELAEHFLNRLRAGSSRPIPTLSNEALHELIQRRWNGNVRELRSVVERATAVATGPEIQPADLQSNTNGTADGGASPTSLEDMERRHIEQVLEHTGWRISETARILKIGRTTLYEKLARYGLRTPGKPTRR